MRVTGVELPENSIDKHSDPPDSEQSQTRLDLAGSKLVSGREGIAPIASLVVASQVLATAMLPLMLRGLFRAAWHF